MSTMGEPAFGGGHGPHSTGHSSARTPSHDWTPYSAVSSFNLPAQYDSSLITPITMAPSPNATSRTSSSMKDRDVKLSPSMDSPDYPLFGGDADDFGSRLNPPMKQKETSSRSMKAPTTTAGDGYPGSNSPLFCATPYYGSFGVSATPKTGRSAELSSPSLNLSPHSTSATGGAGDLQRTRQPTPQSYRVQNTAPILIAPNPQTLRGATRPGEMPYRESYRHDSINSMNSISTSMNSLASTPQAYQDNSMMQLGPLPARRKRKSPPRQLEGELLLSGEISHEEQVLIQLADQEALPWKEVAQRFNEMTGKNMKVPALQMRKKRLRERLRVWTDCEERALTLAWEDWDKGKWDAISEGMMKHGCREKWTKEAVQRKFRELFPDDYHYHPSHYSYQQDYDPREMDHQRMSIDIKMEPRTVWADESGRDSLVRSLTDDETLVDEMRSRTSSDVSSVMHFQQHNLQPVMYAEQQNQREEQQNHQSQSVWTGA
ncbi:ER lumen retaining receptor protein [Rutstroemia sp. NJR-2017a WRK4]|nr:ER lumen retaining receptor protein [Rutstroemia sp. NJR-2017a WRK4]